MTPEEAKNLKVGDVYYRLYSDGDIIDFPIKDKGSLANLIHDNNEATKTLRFVTREDAELAYIQRKLKL